KTERAQSGRSKNHLDLYNTRKDGERRHILIVARKKGGPRHPLFPLPLLPSGPGGVHSCCVTRDHERSRSVGRTRRERDSNPRYLSVHTISNRAPSATRSSLLGGLARGISGQSHLIDRRSGGGGGI